MPTIEMFIFDLILKSTVQDHHAVHVYHGFKAVVILGRIYSFKISGIEMGFVQPSKPTLPMLLLQNYTAKTAACHT